MAVLRGKGLGLEIALGERDFEEALAEIAAAITAGKPAIPCDHKDVTGSIRRGGCATAPDAALYVVRSRVEDSHLG